jgi:exopolyphosphatase/guanosine-5'-triphosphate,3'-diphosphate pyrophosphatase
MKIGILDIGTNSMHIVIAEVGQGMSFEVVGRAKDMTRLGDGTLKTGFIAKEKVERAVSVVKHFALLAKNRGVGKVFGVATAAIREASNGGELLDRIQRESGIQVLTVTGEEESRLIYLAVRHFMNLNSKPALIVDIGGGSAELIVGTDRELLFARSLKLGGARLKDLFITKFPVPKSDHQRIHRHVREAMEPTIEEIRRLGPVQVIGTSGTIINIGSIVSERRDDEQLTNPQGFTFTRDDLDDLHKDLAKADEGELASMKGLDPDRKDILLPGACLMTEVLEALDLESVTLCDKAIREGVILDYIAKNAKKLALEAEIPNVRLRSVMQLARRCEFDEAHGRQTAKLALQLFDQLPLPRDLRPGARELLEYGALLHDIGYHVSFDAHHKHGWYLVVNSEISGFTPEEIDIIAGVVRYHRKRGPKRKDLGVRNLSREDRMTLEVLTAIVRVADALDRSRFGVIDSLKVASRGKSVTIRAAAKDDPAMEFWAARQKVGMLERTLGRSIAFEATTRGDSRRVRELAATPAKQNS